jgi:predicted AAA+ superfamily ATPase
MKRYLYDLIAKDLGKKLILISGPRQCGKTTLSRSFFKDIEYFNYDSSEDRLAIMKKRWRRDCSLVVFDELHKMKSWKRWLKGIYDTEQNKPPLLVTGSANLESYTKVGDSLAGRYFQFRLHPIDLKETLGFWDGTPEEAFKRLMLVGGFPEPFLAGTERFYRRWQKTHINIMLRQDILDIKSIRTIQSIETLMALLQSRVGSSISWSNLARDLEVDPKTVKSWIQLLENIYVVFAVLPYHKKVVRSILKEPKYYFFDNARVSNHPSLRLENLVACALQKACHFLEDTTGVDSKLFFLRTKDGKEIDFLVTVDGKPRLAIEVKTSNNSPSPAFHHFDKQLNIQHKVQLVLNLNREMDTSDGIQIRSLVPWLSQLDLGHLFGYLEE